MTLLIVTIIAILVIEIAVYLSWMGGKLQPMLMKIAEDKIMALNDETQVYFEYADFLASRDSSARDLFSKAFDDLDPMQKYMVDGVYIRHALKINGKEF